MAVVQIAHSSAATNVPTALVAGQLAINEADEVLFYRNVTNTINSVYLPPAMQMNTQSSGYTLVLADAGKCILHPSADTTARTWAIPPNASVAFFVGTPVTFVNQNGAGTLTITSTTDTMRLAGSGSTTSRTLLADGIATAVKVTTTEWIISGSGLS